MNKVWTVLLMCWLGLVHSSFAETQQAPTDKPILYEVKSFLKEQHLLDLERIYKSKNATQPLRLILRDTYGFGKRQPELLLRFANWIDQNPIEVAAEGICAGECGLLFFSARTKILLKSPTHPPSFVILQAQVNEDGEYDDAINAFFKKLIQKNSDNRIPDLFFEKITQVHDWVGGVLVANPSDYENSNSFFSKRSPDKAKPVVLDGYTLEKLGILNE